MNRYVSNKFLLIKVIFLATMISCITQRELSKTSNPSHSIIENRLLFIGQDLTWFLPPDLGPKHSTQRDLSEEVAAIARQKNKPMMIAESSNQGYDNAKLTKRNITEILDGPAGKNQVQKEAKDIWKEWYAPFFNWIEKNGDVIKAVSYINAEWDSQQMWGPPYHQGYWGDSRIEVNEEIRRLWKAEFSKAFWENKRK